MIDPVVLEGDHVRLEPLGEGHGDGLTAAVRDGELWKLFYTMVPRPDAIEGFIQQAMKDQRAGVALAFATIDKRIQRVAGSTRFMNANLGHRRIEIGFTFLGKSWQRSPINTEAKLLMLTHAFDSLDLNRVEFLTDYLNVNSRRAILRLGAKEEGVLRNHSVMADGRVRDSVLFSVIKNEWPGVRQNLESKRG